MTESKKLVNILSGYRKEKGVIPKGIMKHFRLGKIQWISLLVVSAMFANLCSHMVLAASTKKQVTTQTVTTATKKATTVKEEEYKAFWFSFYDYDDYRAKYFISSPIRSANLPSFTAI